MHIPTVDMRCITYSFILIASSLQFKIKKFQSNHYNPLQRGRGVSKNSQKIITLMVGGLLLLSSTLLSFIQLEEMKKEN